MKTAVAMLGMLVAVPLFAFDYRELRANFDDLFWRDDELLREADRLRHERATEMEAHTAAMVIAEQSRIAFDAERVRQAKAEAALAATKREVIVGPGPAGRVVKGGKDFFHGPAPTTHPPAPDGFVWLFPLDPLDYRIARKDPDVLPSGDRRRLELISVQRAREAYPFLGDKSDPRRVQFDHFLRAHSELPLFKQLFSLTCWPVLAAHECATLNKW